MLKGYYTSSCYKGYIEDIDQYMPFASERDYIEYMEERTKLKQKVIHVVVPNKAELNKHVIDKITLNGIKVE